MSIEKITLTKPLLVNGKYLKELTYDIEELTEEILFSNPLSIKWAIRS